MQLARCNIEGHHHVAVRTCNPLPHERVRAAVIGGGSSKFSAADQVLKAGFGVDVLQVLPTPFGLARAGVAPDHTAETLAKVVEEADAGRLDSAAHQDAESVERWLRTRAPALVTWAGWRALDDHETSLGARHGRPHVKLCNRAAMLAAAATSAVATR